jgi:hypothetical protein
MTLGELRERMPQAEFIVWQRYHRVRLQAQELEQKAATARMGR